MSDAIQISVTDDELAALLAVLGQSPNQLSPILELVEQAGAMGADCRSELIGAGVFETDRAALTQDGHDLLARLLRPQTRIGICAGTSDWMATTTSVAAGDLTDHEPMVSIVRDDDGWAIGWPQPAADLVAMLQDHFTGPVLSSPVPFEHTLPVHAYVALLAVFDHLLANQLQCTLDRLPVQAEPFGAQEVWYQIVEGRTGSNLAWQVTVTRVLFPEMSLDLDQADVEAGLKDLVQRGLLFVDDDGRFLPSEALLAVVEGFVPVFRFGAARVDRLVEPEVVSTIHVAIRAGLGTIMLEEVGEDGVLIRSVGSMQLEDLILNFRVPEPTESKTSGPAASVSAPEFCSQCGTASRRDAAFCVNCGNQIQSEVQP